MCGDSEQLEDGIHKAPYPSYRTWHRNAKGKKNAESKAEKEEKTKYKKLAPKLLPNHLRPLEKADSDKH